MADKSRRIALLVELPKGTAVEMVAFRRMLKALLRSFGLKCLAVKPADETKMFGNQGDKDEETNKVDGIDA